MELFADLAGSVGGALVATAKTALPALLFGAAVKHGGRATRRIPNNSIPLANIVVGTAVALVSGAGSSAAAVSGVNAAAGGVFLHQTAKIAARAIFDNLERRTGVGSGFAKRVGPGRRLSL